MCTCVSTRRSESSIVASRISLRILVHRTRIVHARTAPSPFKNSRAAHRMSSRVSSNQCPTAQATNAKNTALTTIASGGDEPPCQPGSSGADPST